MYKKQIFLLVFLVSSSLFISLAMGQTTMQRQEMKDAGEWEEPEEEEADEEASTASQTTSTQRRTQSAEQETRRGDEYVQSETTWVHIPGLRFDYGGTFHDDAETEVASALGLGYMYAWEWDLTIIRSGSLLRIGVGPDLMFVTKNWERLNGMTTHLTGRISGIGPTGGLTVEVGAGPSIGGGGLRPTAKFGVYGAGRVFEIGYYFQTPIVGTRPDWITSHHLGLRLHFSMFRH